MHTSAVVALIPLVAVSAIATDGTWNGNTNANWNVTTNWANGTVASGAGATATIDRVNFTGTRTLTLNADLTLGNIAVLGMNTASRNAIISGSGRTLTLNNNSDASLISNAGWGNVTINVSTLSLANDLNLRHSPSTGDSSEVNHYLTIDSTIQSSSAGLRTITTLPSASTASDPNRLRIVLGGNVTDGAGQVAIRHTSGNNLNFQTTAKTFTGGLYIQSGAVRVNTLGNSGLGGAGNVVTFESPAEGAPPAVLEFHGVTDVANATIDKTAVLTGAGTISVASDVGRDIVWTGAISGAGSLTKSGVGTLVLAGANTYTGQTIVSDGTLVIGASNTISDSSIVNLAGGSLIIGNGFTNTVGGLDLNASATISIGSGASLAFGDSSAFDWGSFTLAVEGDFVSGASLRFGTDANGLTPAQLARIQINGLSDFGLNAQGFLVVGAIPEPSAAALLVGLSGLACAMTRRRRN